MQIDSRCDKCLRRLSPDEENPDRGCSRYPNGIPNEIYTGTSDDPADIEAGIETGCPEYYDEDMSDRDELARKTGGV